MAARRKPNPVSPAQRELAGVILARFGLTAPEAALEDPRWVGNLLDVFAWDAESGQGGYRALRSLVLRCIEGCDADHIAGVIGVSAEAVRQAVQVLRASGYTLDPVEEDLGIDPEEQALARQERALEDPDLAPGPDRGLEALLALCTGETAALPISTPVMPVERRMSAAWRFLAGADYGTRRRWLEEAQRRGAPVGASGTARENLHLWIDYIADDLK